MLPSVRRLSPSDAAEASALLAGAAEPLVLSGRIESWRARGWTPLRLAREHGAAELCVRLHPRGLNHAREAECIQQRASLAQLCAWLEGSQETGGLARYNRREFVAYSDYQDMGVVFAGDREALSAIDWSTVGIPRDGAHSTLWLGSEGAHTPIHQDSYGWNLVAQLHGTKRWRLYHPQDLSLHPTRIPYEESSVYAYGGAPPDNKRAEQDSPSIWETTLGPGDVLFVPKHWWHLVTTTSSSALSVNTWVDAADDAHDRLREALVRSVICAMMQHYEVTFLAAKTARTDDCESPAPPAPFKGQSMPTVEAHPSAEDTMARSEAWLNPTEEVWSPSDNLAAVHTSLVEAHPEYKEHAPQISAADIVDAFCTGEALDAAMRALRRRCGRLRTCKRPRDDETEVTPD